MNDAGIVGKILIKGELILKSPLLIGDGAGETSENFKDIHVLRNHDDKPFIPGTSLCGVLRDYMNGVNPAIVGEIFGDGNKMQSSIQLDDIVLDDSKIIARDGVKIDGYTGVGIDGAKYDYEAVERGVKGYLRLLINLRGIHLENFENFSSAISQLMGKLKSGIRLGALTSKGFGLIAVKKLKAQHYDFRNKADVKAWLTNKPASKKITPSDEKILNNPNDLIVKAEFTLNSSLIIRDYEVSASDKNDKISAVSLKSRGDFVIPGTSLKGIFRHRAEYIFDKLGLDKNLLKKLMGTSDGDKKIKSRFIVEESYIKPEGVMEIAHTRNKIDRITSGTLQGTLFTTKPIWNKNSTIKIKFEIRGAKDYEVGLAISLLRDMWLGHVEIGGEKSIGRGTLSGKSATINFKGKTYELDDKGKVTGDVKEISRLASSIKNWGESE